MIMTNNREVRFFYVDNNERSTTNSTDDPSLKFTERDWVLFYSKVWPDLQEGTDTPLFIGEWNGLIMGTRYRILGDQINKHPNDYVFILCSDCGANPEFQWPICEKDHLKLYDLKFMFQWKDLPVMAKIFSKVDQLFHWTHAYERYTNIKVKLFHPEWDVPCRKGSRITPPTIYKL